MKVKNIVEGDKFARYDLKKKTIEKYCPSLFVVVNNRFLM
jgi:hypothetical protein